MSSLALSVLLSLVSAVAYAAGAIVQEHVATAGDGRVLALVRDRVWWAAVTLNGTGAVLHVAALAYGPLSLVQPLGALTIVFVLPMAAMFVGRRPGAAAWRGAVMASVGLAGLLALTGGSGPHALDDREQLRLAGVTLGVLGALLLISRGARRSVVRSVILAGAAGVAFGMASVFTKTVAMQWGSGTPTAGVLSLPAIAVFAAAGLLLSQAAYRGAGLTAPLATVTVANPVMAAAVGITMFDERFRYGASGTVLALVCGVAAAGGLVLLTTERLGAEQGARRPADDGRPCTTAKAPDPAYANAGAGDVADGGRPAHAGPAHLGDTLAGADGSGPPAAVQTLTPPALR
ncbi:DMT family transporter [Streptomyces sp. NPDC014734]|uniref:DMT family transporter n=1 Tax=Streptomyces sp. NPDC014734 TaxID=3364886 RepID=UPI0036F7B140